MMRRAGKTKIEHGMDDDKRDKKRKEKKDTICMLAVADCKMQITHETISLSGAQSPRITTNLVILYTVTILLYYIYFFFLLLLFIPLYDALNSHQYHKLCIGHPLNFGDDLRRFD